MRQFRERARRCRCRVVVGPSPNERVEPSNQGCLGRVCVAPDRFPNGLTVTVDRFCAGSDDGFEAKQLSLSITSRMGFTHRVLLDVEAEEVKTNGSFVFRESVCDACLA